MAKRRMLMENIISSDDFTKLHHSAQILYIHLNMEADDDGFVGCLTRTMRSLKVQSKHFEVLVEKGYIIAFESGVIAITHWRSHNRIRADRYTPTRYKEERKLLKIIDDERYEKNTDT